MIDPPDFPTGSVEHQWPELVIEPTRGWRSLNLRELVAYRDLLYFLVLRDIKVLYKQTVLGFSWALLRPLLSMVVLTFVFGRVAKISSDGVPYAIFNYVAIVPWTYFASSLTGAATSLVSNAPVLNKIYLPRIVFPLTPILAKLVDFAIAMTIVGVLMAWYRIAPSTQIVFLPILVALMTLTALGASVWLSALAIQYRDVNHAMQFVIQLLMFAAPVIWPVSALTARFGPRIRLIYGLYPMAGVIEGFRASLISTTAMPWDLIGLGTASALVVTITGLVYFRRVETDFADVA